MPTDPYRVLGLPRDATLAEVKQAYRRLAKAFHPDTAGQAAVPRFIEIQEAYESLVGGSPARRGRARPGGSPAREPWRADADRARAARDAREAAGPGQASDRPRSRSRRATPPSGSAEPGDRTGARPKERRSRKRATPGSTSYDGVDQEPFDPDWAGASWYGATSGTYWTLNPKEYADPRKHGPEYQARARRRTGRAESTAGLASGPDGAPVENPAASGTEPAHRRPESAAPRDAPAAAAASASARRRRPVFATAFPPAPSVPPAAAESGLGTGATLLRIVDDARRSLSGRFVLALVGWVPIGIVLGVAIGESTGCARFAAECQGPFGAATLIGQGSVVVLLLLVPRLAAVATLGTIAMLAAAIPTAAVLSISGGARDPAGATPMFVIVLAVAWGVGIAAGLVRTGFSAASGRRPPVP
jgi:hypothetical protein